MTASGFSQRCKSILASLDRLVFPPVCLACHARVPAATEILCADCCAKLQPIGRHYCPKCGAPLKDYRCGPCSETIYVFDFARAAYVYESPAQELVHRLKYEALRAPARFFAQAILHHPSVQRLRGNFDLVLAVPLHHVRQRDRGYNQSRLIAKQIAQGLNLPCAKPVLRHQNTLSQTNLSREARKRNLQGAFSLRRKAHVAGKRVILVDDVFTTGTTVNEISGLLKDRGAARVAVLTASRAV